MLPRHLVRSAKNSGLEYKLERDLPKEYYHINILELNSYDE